MYITEDSTPYAVKVMHPGLLPEINSRKGSSFSITVEVNYVKFTLSLSKY